MPDTVTMALIRRIESYLRHPTGAEVPDAEFASLALDAFRWQWERSAVLRRLAAARGVDPAVVARWEEIPLVPVTAFKGDGLGIDLPGPVEVFRSSGTQGHRSVHRHPFPDLYRASIDATFGAACLPAPAPLPILSLVPSRATAPDSSLAFMVDHVMRRFAAPSSLAGYAERGLELTKVRSWLSARQRERGPCLVIATGFALLELLDGLARLELRLRLPPGSVVFETGGLKGRTREIGRPELLALLETRLGVPRARVVREYGMTELTSQAYTRALQDGDPDLFVPPPWMRVRALDPATLAPTAPGQPGLLAIFDLANLGSAVHILTQDLGEVATTSGGFRLLGRAAGADLRGCSLLAEELGAAPAS